MVDKKFRIPVHDVSIRVIQAGPKDPVWNKYNIKPVGPKEDVLAAVWYGGYNLKASILIGFPVKVTDSLIVHECVHAAYRVLDRSDIKVPVENHEILALMTEYIFEKVTKLLKSK